RLRPLPFPLEALDSGALRPKKSQLAVFGYTRDLSRARRLTDLIPCENCSFSPCQYRRASNGRPKLNAPCETFHFLSGNGKPPDAPAYYIRTKALKRWSEERLTLRSKAGGAIDAVFRYDGTTCSNMGRPLAFDYRVRLGSRESGYPIQEQQCSPAPGDTGHTFM